MKKIITRTIQYLSFKVIGRNLTKKTLVKLFHVLDFDLLSVAHSEMGINNYGSMVETGEAYLLYSFLKSRFKAEPIVIFDVGANVGEFAILCNKVFPSAIIYAFEPNPSSFKKLSVLEHFYSFNIGFGSKQEILELYTYKNHPESEHASLIENVLVKLHKAENVMSEKIQITTLDSFCEKNKVERIHFLKIDTEGHELEVLKGAVNFINKKRIDVVQFEFNEMNTFSRVFLQDFYDMLPGYNFFRLSTGKLIPLGKYNRTNEIFKFQNIVAVLN